MWLGAFLFGTVAYFQNTTISVPSEKLYYLNSPESILKSGLLGSIVTPDKEQKTRVFFHFVNKTHKKQQFVIHFNHGIKNYRFGYGISSEPGCAGVGGVKHFFDCKPVDKIGGVCFSTMLESGETISGICDGFTEANTTIESFFGNNKHIFPNKVSESNNVTEQIELFPSVIKSDVIRLGTHRNNFVDGDYGTTFKFVIKPVMIKASVIEISISPRGGRASMCFIQNGLVKLTPVVPTKHTLIIYKQTINPGESFIFETILPGGYSYPVEMHFSIH
jgi:hypothetical protein